MVGSSLTGDCDLLKVTQLVRGGARAGLRPPSTQELDQDSPWVSAEGEVLRDRPVGDAAPILDLSLDGDQAVGC